MFLKISNRLSLRKRKFSRTLKALTSKKLNSAAKINLNQHWKKFEEIYGKNHNSKKSPPPEPLDLSNEMNENLLNESLQSELEKRNNFFSKEAMVEEKENLLTPPNTPLDSPYFSENNLNSNPTLIFDFINIVEDLTRMEEALTDRFCLPPNPTSLDESCDFFNFEFLATSTPTST